MITIKTDSEFNIEGDGFVRICIFTLGSRGDIQPYVALAKKLIQHGHEATVCTGGSFRSFVESNSVSFVPVSSDLMAIAQTEVGKAVLEHPVRNMRKAMELSKDVINPAYRKTLDEFYTAAEHADCILYHPKALGAVDIALHYGIPCVSMPPVPITYPIEEFPNLALTTKNLGKKLNRMSYMINAKAESSQMDLINDFREKTLGQGKRKPGIYAFHDGHKEIPVVYPISHALFPDVTSWNDHVLLPGFFFLEENQEKIPGDLEHFIGAGQKPIAVTFSSMPLSDPERFLSNLRSALKETGNRAVLLTGNTGIRCEHDDLIYSLPAISHQWLFSKVKGVIHHGGVGTMAAALRAGVPQMIMPFSADQPFWAKRLTDIGLGIESLKEKTATAQLLSDRIRQMDDPERIRKATDFAQMIQTENGTEDTVRYLEKLVL